MNQSHFLRHVGRSSLVPTNKQANNLNSAIKRTRTHLHIQHLRSSAVAHYTPVYVHYKWATISKSNLSIDVRILVLHCDFQWFEYCTIFAGTALFQIPKRGLNLDGLKINRDLFYMYIMPIRNIAVHVLYSMYCTAK